MRDTIRCMCLAGLLCFALPLFSADKVALLFLTRKDINHSELWQRHLEKHPDEFSIYVHSAQPMKDPFFAQYRIKNIVPTRWEKHVMAWQELVKEAIKDPDNKKFVFLSESCIPIRPLVEIYGQLSSTSHSCLWLFKGWWPEWDGREVVELPAEHRWRNHEWVILNRDHATLVAEDKFVIHACAKHWSDTEAYVGHLLSYHGVLFGPDVQNCPTTYTNWSEGNASPHTFISVSEQEEKFLQSLASDRRDRPYLLFARKFAASFPDDVIETFMEDGRFPQ